MKFEVISDRVKDMNVIRITEDKFKGCEFIIGEVSFDEKDEGLLHFDYEITNDFLVKKEDMDSFVQTIGDILTNILEDALNKQEVIYKGGK